MGLLKMDGFVFKTIDHLSEALKLFESEGISLYRIYPDGTDAAIETRDELMDSYPAKDTNIRVGIEVGFDKDLRKLKNGQFKPI